MATYQEFYPGDLVVLTRGGTRLSAEELMAIWTIERVRDDYAIVFFDPDIQTVDLSGLSCKSYPLSWLVLYKSGRSN